MGSSAQDVADRLAQTVQRTQQGTSTAADRLAGQQIDISATLFGQAQFDKETGLPFLTRLKVGAADTPDEQIKAFLDDYPEGQIERVPVRGDMVFKFNREDQTEQWKTIEREMPAELTVDSVLKESLEFGKDVSEVMVNTIGPIAGEVLAAIATRGQSLALRLAALFGGAAAGELAQEGAERAIFEGDESALSVARRTGASGIAAPVGFGIGAGVGRAVQGVRGRGFLSTSPEAREAMRSIEEINRLLEQSGSDVRIPQLSVGQAAEAPIFRRLEEQSAALTSPVRRQRQEQVAAVQKVLDEAVDQQAIDSGRRVLREAYEAEQKRLLDRISDPKVVLSQAGEALDEGIHHFDQAAGIHVDGLYELARKIEEPIFDIGDAVRGEGLQGVAVRGLRGVPVGVRKFSEEEIKQLVEAGVPASAFRRGTLKSAPPDPQVEGIATEMILANPETVTTEVLRSWRSRLWDLAQTPSGELAGQRQYQARRLMAAVNRTLDNPSNPNPTFVRSWREANDAARFRFDTLEKAQVARIVRSGDMSSGETIEQLALSLQSPHNASNLRFLKSIIPPDDYKRFTDAFKTRLLSDVDNIGQALDTFDQETLQYLLSPTERGAFRTLSEGLELLNSTGVQQQLRAQAQPREFLRGLLERSDTAGIAQLLSLVRSAGGVRSETGKAVRYGLMDIAFDKFIVDGSVQQMSKAAINDFLTHIRRMGLAGFLERGDRRLIREFENIAPFFRFDRGGAGASIQAAEAASGVVEGSRSAIWELIEKAGAGRALVNPRVRSFLMGRPGSQPMDTELIKILSAVALTSVVTTGETAASVELLNSVQPQ